MLQVTGVSLQFGQRVLFENVNIKFTKGNCYGIIGANGAGKSTFLKVLTGEIEPNKGEVTVSKNERMSVLQQNQNAYDDKTVRDTVMWGHKRLMELNELRNALYSKADFTEEDGMKAAEYETEFAELGGYEAEANADAMLNSLGVPAELADTLMADVDPKIKVKVLLAQALFGKPDILILDEPTNNLDARTANWLEDYLMDLDDTCIIIVSHNRHFLNRVCTHICDVDYRQITMYVGNYDFWYESSQLLLRQQKEANKKAEARAKELREFIARFSANAKRAKSATSRKKELEKLERLCFSRPWSRKMLAEELENQCAAFLVAQDGETGQVIDYAGLLVVADEGYITNVAVFPEYRRQGVAAKLLAVFENFARGNHLAFLTLEVRPSNAAAIALYESFGFKQAGRRKNYYDLPKEDALILTKTYGEAEA